MAETRPTGEQLRFVSAATGEHILDTYLEAAEKGGRQLPDMLADIYDPVTGLFRADIFDFRVASDLKLQFRVGDFPDLVTGWRDVEGSPFLFFAPRGTWAPSTAYAITDLVRYNNATYYALTAHTSTSTFDTTKWSLILDDTSLNTAVASAQASATTATTQATNAAASAATANTRATNAQTSATAAAASQSAAATSATNAASSATTATTQATNASTSATAAASSASTATTQATNAANSATAASSSASAASTSASNASTSASNAATSASTASTQASNASTSATSASNSATTATTQASNASTSAANAASSASAASTSATNAANSASAASSSASAAATSATNAAASYDSFDDRYLGPKTTNPTVDNDGNALLTGALYWNSTASEMRVYTGSAWVIFTGATNLDGLSDVTITTPATGNLVRYNGTQWVNYPDSNYAAASHIHSISDVTNLQTSLDAKQPADSYLAITASATTVTLTSASPRLIYVSGTTTQTIILPDVSTLALGWTFTIINASTGSVTVQSSGANTIGLTQVAGIHANYTCILTSGTTAASWNQRFTGATTRTGQGAAVYGSSPTITAPVITSSTSAAVTAGTNAQGQGALTNDNNVVTTAANNPSGVTLPTATVGRRVTIANRGANPINVYPATGAAIDALGANTALQIPVNGKVMFSASSTTQWYSFVAVSNGDKGEIAVSNNGATWTIDDGVVTTTKLGGDITTAGKALLDDADAAAQRTTLGLAIGTNVQAWDADLDAIAAISSTSGLLRKTAANTWSLDTTSYAQASHAHAISDVTNLQTTLDGKQPLDADLTSIASLAGTSGLLRKTALNTFDLGSVRTKMRVFLDGGQYIPSAGTKSIFVYLTGSGASGGSVITTNATNSTTFGAYCATGGSGAGTIVFSMDATPADEFQVSIGAAPAATPASGTALALNGNVSRFNKMVSGSPVNIATAPGGVRGTSNLFAAGMSGPVAPAAIAAPDPAYVASGQYLAIPGGMGEVGVPGYGGTGNGGASNGRGGSSFWGSGAGEGAIKNGSTGGGNFRSGQNAVSYGSGGAGGVAIKYSSAGVFSATGGAGAKGICVIIEVLN